MTLAFFIGYELIDPVFVRFPALIVGNINPCVTVVGLEVCDSRVHSACDEIIGITARPWKVGISGGRVKNSRVTLRSNGAGSYRPHSEEYVSTVEDGRQTVSRGSSYPHPHRLLVKSVEKLVRRTRVRERRVGRIVIYIDPLQFVKLCTGVRAPSNGDNLP
jgi:hypothetical protein